MVPLLKNNSTQGIYITADDAGKILANTPGDLDIGNLTLGTNYIYFDTLLRFEEKWTMNREEPDFIGWKTWSPSALNVQASTGGSKRTFYLISVEIDETTAEYMKTLSAFNVQTGNGIRYLIKQTASEAFEQFVNSSGVLKKFAATIIRGFDVAELANSGKDTKVMNIALEHIAARN